MSTSFLEQIQRVLQNTLAACLAYQVNPVVTGSAKPITDELKDALREVDKRLGKVHAVLKPNVAAKRANHDRFASLAEQNPEAITFDGLDKAYIGMATVFGQPPVAAYDYEKCLAIFMERGMDREAAVEWMEFNVTGAYVGESTPVFVDAAA